MITFLVPDSTISTSGNHRAFINNSLYGLLQSVSSMFKRLFKKASLPITGWCERAAFCLDFLLRKASLG